MNSRIKSDALGVSNDVGFIKRKDSGLFNTLNKPSLILFKKTLFKDMFKIPKVMVSLLLMILGPLISILVIPPYYHDLDRLNDYLGLTYAYYTYCIMFPIILTVIGAPLIAEELRSGTMLTLISKPLSRGGILFTKYLAFTCFGLFINLISLSTITLIAPLKYPFEGVAEFFVINLFFSLIIQFFFQTLVFGFTSIVKKTRSAILFPLLIIIITFFVLMSFRPMFFYMHLGDSEEPIYVQFQLYHYDLGYHLFNVYTGILEVVSGNVPNDMMYFLFMMGLYTQEWDEETYEYTFRRNDFYTSVGSLIFLISIAIVVMLLGYFIFKKRDISR